MYYKRLPEFDYLAPGSVEEALGLAAQNGNKATFMAGGTILLARMKERIARPAYVISLKSVKGLDGVEYSKKNGLSVGSAATLQTIANSADVQANYPMLAKICGHVWTQQVRNMATLGGNVASRLSTAQAVPVLVALGAETTFASSAGEKSVAVEKIAEAFKDDALMVGVKIPSPTAKTRMGYQRFAVRDRYDWAIAAAAVALTMDGKTCKAAKIGLGGVPVRSARATEAEELLSGQKITEEVIEKVADAAVAGRAMAADEMFSEEYKLKVLKTMVRRALTEAAGV